MNGEDLGVEERKCTQHVVEFEQVVSSERTNNAHCRDQTKKER